MIKQQRSAAAIVATVLVAQLAFVPMAGSAEVASRADDQYSSGGAQLAPDGKHRQQQQRPVVTTYPAGTTSSARGGDTVSIASTDIGTTTPTPGAIPVAGTDSKISTGWLPTSVLTGTGTTNYLPKKTASGYGDSRVVDDGINPVEAPNLRLTGLLTSTTFPLTQLSQLSGAYVLVAPILGQGGVTTSTGLVFRSAPAGGIFQNAIVSRRFGFVWQAALDFYVHPYGTANVDEMKLALTLDDSGALLYGLLSANGVALRGSTSGSIARQASATGGVTTLVEPSAPPTAVGQVLAVASLSTTGTATNTATLSWKAVLGEDATISTTPPLALSSTGTITETVTNTDTGTNTGTGTVSGSATATATNTATATASATRSGSDTFTRTNTFTTTGTYTFSGTGNGVDAFSVTLTTTTTGTVTGTATVTMTGTATATAGSGTGTVTSTVSATSTATSSATATQTVMSPGTADRYTITRAKTATSTGTVTLTEYVTISLTGTNTASGSGTVTATVTGTATATATGTASGTWSGTSTSSATQTTTGSSTNAATGRIADSLTVLGDNVANRALSNLSSPTAINQHLLPGTDATIDICSLSKRCRFGFATQWEARNANGSRFSSLGYNGDSGHVYASHALRTGGSILAYGDIQSTTGFGEFSNLTRYGHAIQDLSKPDVPCGTGQALTSTEGTTTYCIDVGGAGSLARPTSVCAPGEVLTSYTEGVSTCVSNGSGSGIACAGGSCTTYRLPMFTNSSSVANSPITASGSDVYIDHYIVASNIDINGNTTGRAAGDCHSDGTNCPTAATLGALPSTTAHVVNIDSHYSTNSYSAAPGNCVTLTSAAVTASTNATYMTVQATASLRSAHSSPARCGIKILVNGSAGPQWGYAREEAHFMSLAVSGYYVGSSGTTYTYTLQMCALDDTHTCSLDATSASTWEHASITVQLYGY